ncbi:hypothetical protein KAI87_17275 [Myxococcota bacterium]|nr:hypothetical protein [Myxococcota bacterium]
MAELEALMNDLANLDAQHDMEGMRGIRTAIIEEHPNSDEAVEALYKLGLDELFRQRALNSAVEKFTEAAKRKHPFWSAAARTSLGLCYYHQKRVQKAIFELRKVAYSKPPSPHSVTALAFMETIFVNEGQSSEAKKARAERITQLLFLIDASLGADMGQERGFHLYTLGLAYKDAGQNDEGDQALRDAKKLGKDTLGEDLFRSVIEALQV